jgi:hypothetical protein
MTASIETLGRQFENFVFELLKSNRFTVSRPPNLSPGIDFDAKQLEDTWAVEVKYYRTKRAQQSLIERAAARLLACARDANYTKAMLVLSSYLDPELRESLEKRFSILFIDRVDLSIWATQAPHLVDLLASLLGEAASSEHKRKESPIDPGINLADNTLLSLPSPEGENLCQELCALQEGKKNWRRYEVLCERILRYLFSNDLTGWHRQKRTDDGLNRYDLICRLMPTTNYWTFVDGRLSSRYVLFEFKNYSASIKQGQVLTTEKYLFPCALRCLGIILSRKGADKAANLVIAGAMRESGKMILVLDDDTVCRLLRAKDNGDDPSDIMFQITDDFLMTINR